MTERSLTLPHPGAALLLMAVFPAIGLAFVVQPLVLAAALAGLAFVAVCFVRPTWALGLFAFAQIAFPVYVRLPAIGPLPPVPIAAAMMAVLASVTTLSAVVLPRQSPLHGVGRLLLVLLLVFGAVTLTSLIDERTSSEGLGMWFKAFLFPFVMLLVGIRTLRGATDVDLIYRFLLAAGCATAAFALFEAMLGRNILLDNFEGETGVEYFTVEELGSGLAYRAFSVFTQPIEFGTCLGMIFPYALIRLATARTLGERFVFGAGAGMCALGIFLTFSRGPLLALVIATVAIGLIYRSLRPWLIGFFAVAALAFALAWPWLGAGISERVGDFDNVTLRFKLWETAASLFADHPLRGVGFGNFPEYYLDAAREHQVGPFYEFGQDSLEKIRVAENTYLQLAAETGIIGVLSAAALVGAFLMALFRTIRSASDARSADLGLAVGAGLLIYVINGLTITAYTHYVSTMLLFGVLFPFAIVLHRGEAHCHGGTAQSHPPGCPGGSRPGPRIG